MINLSWPEKGKVTGFSKLPKILNLLFSKKQTLLFTIYKVLFNKAASYHLRGKKFVFFNVSVSSSMEGSDFASSKVLICSFLHILPHQHIVGLTNIS